MQRFSGGDLDFCLLQHWLKHARLACLASFSCNGFECDRMTRLKHAIDDIFVASCRGARRARVFEAVAPETV